MTSWNEARDEIVRSQARSIIRELELQDPDEIKIESIAFLRGALVLERPLNGCEGRVIRNGSRVYITVDSAIRQLGRKRFAIAHELGHVELHMKEESSQLSLFQDQKLSSYWYTKCHPHEQEANIFASELLMPEVMFKSRCDGGEPSLEDVERLAQQFQTTLTATARRYVELSSFDCALIYTENGKRKWFVKSEDFPLKVNLGYLSSEKAMRILRGEESPKEMSSGHATDWFEGTGVHPHLQVLEDSRKLGKYDSMLTLVWLDEELETDSWY